MIRTFVVALGLCAATGLFPNSFDQLAHAQGKLIYRGTSEYGFSRSSHAPTAPQHAINLSIEQIRSRIDQMVNIAQFSTFTKQNVTKDLDVSGSYAKVIASGRVKYATSSTSESAVNWIANGNTWVVVVENPRIKPGTWYSRTDKNWKGERSSIASATILFDYEVHGPQGTGSTTSKVRYTIRNDSGRTVRFSMRPSGKSYELAAGRTFTGTSSQIDGKPPSMTITNTGRTYRLTSGDHKFWWMKSEGRIGFDRNIKD